MNPLVHRVYRVENWLGHGPYRGGLFSGDAARPMPHHPLPCSDINCHQLERMPEEHRRYAFASLRQLLDWFTRSDLLALHDAGFYLAVIDVDVTRVYGVHIEGRAIAFGERQVCFHSRAANCVEKGSLKTLLHHDLVPT